MTKPPGRPRRPQQAMSELERLYFSSSVLFAYCCFDLHNAILRTGSR
jgi:hypothetical protein